MEEWKDVGKGFGGGEQDKKRNIGYHCWEGLSGEVVREEGSRESA